MTALFCDAHIGDETKRLEDMPVSLADKDEDAWLKPDEYQELVRLRRQHLLNSLEEKPFVFLEGVAGSGKTTLLIDLEKNLSSEVQVFYEDKLSDWAARGKTDESEKKR